MMNRIWRSVDAMSRGASTKETWLQTKSAPRRKGSGRQGQEGRGQIRFFRRIKNQPRDCRCLGQVQARPATSRYAYRRDEKYLCRKKEWSVGAARPEIRGMHSRGRREIK